MRIMVAGNGPSAQVPGVRALAESGRFDRVFRTNYFFLPARDALDYQCSDWFVCEEIEDYRCARAWCAARATLGGVLPTIWMPGLRADRIAAAEKHLPTARLQIQRLASYLPAGCRWDRDQAPERPLMGSFALAVAVGLQPAELCICGIDLFQHPGKGHHGGVSYDTRAWQDEFVRQYLINRHRNHTLRGDLKYIRSALSEYQGRVICVGSVMRHYFADEFPAWEWIDG